MAKEVVLTGLRTNGEYHLGNYIGAMKPIISLAQAKAGQYQINLFTPDLHSFTTPIDHDNFYRQTIDNIKLFVAAGMPLDNDEMFIYRQSFIPAHSEFTWLLSNFTGFGEMSRMVEFKEKSDRLEDNRVTVGLFSYPILMAADILLYNAKWVPVGDDQRQHLEFTRTIADRINNKFDLDLTIPASLTKQQQFVGRTDAPRIRSLRKPAQKMSKSIDDPNGTIMLSDNPDEARKKIISAETDSLGKIAYDWQNQPGITNLLTILANLRGQKVDETIKDWQDQSQYGALKATVADEVANFLSQIQSKLDAVDEKQVLDHLKQSESIMNQTANQTLIKLQRAIGLRS